MTDAQKLEALIKRAIEGGFDDPLGAVEDRLDICNGRLGTENFDHWYPLEGTVFNKDFARALFGEATERVWLCPKCDYSFDYTWHGESEDHCPHAGRKLRDTTRVKKFGDHPWQYHLQQAVISDNPIEYYYEQVFRDK